MKRIFAALLALAMLLAAAALAETVEAPAFNYIGTWYLNELLVEGASMAPATFGMQMTMTLNADGTAALSGTGVEGMEDATGIWAETTDGVSVTVGEETMAFAQTGGKLVSNLDGTGMVFGRQQAQMEVYRPGAPVATASAEDYAGVWKAHMMEMDGAYVDAALLGMDITAAIEGTTITLNGFFFSGDALEAEFAGGALTYAADSEEAMLSAASAQLLSDGNLRLTLGEGEEAFGLIMTRAE